MSVFALDLFSVAILGFPPCSFIILGFQVEVFLYIGVGLHVHHSSLDLVLLLPKGGS